MQSCSPTDPTLSQPLQKIPETWMWHMSPGATSDNRSFKIRKTPKLQNRASISLKDTIAGARTKEALQKAGVQGQLFQRGGEKGTAFFLDHPSLQSAYIHHQSKIFVCLPSRNGNQDGKPRQMVIGLLKPLIAGYLSIKQYQRKVFQRSVSLAKTLLNPDRNKILSPKQYPQGCRH